MIKFRLLKDNMHTVRMICANEALRFLMGAPVVNVTLSHYPRIKVGGPTDSCAPKNQFPTV